MTVFIIIYMENMFSKINDQWKPQKNTHGKIINTPSKNWNAYWTIVLSHWFESNISVPAFPLVDSWYTENN